ncbi:hypothetical protein EYS14_18210 [Alteromonadaceae bacterium M269]|nr:hypothetical protein EYS14_18210 [Alteromonadaceae bacterium M269]
MKKTIVSLSVLATLTLGTSSTVLAAGDLTANATVTSNYLWRGLTQNLNEAAVQGGIDYVDESGFYIGTWASNVEYAPGDDFSYEHDVYFGYSGEVNSISYDVGYLYYNYDSAADIDFSEIYGSLSYGNFSIGANIFVHTQADEPEGIDFDFGDTIYYTADYAFEVRKDLELALHIGYHDGDFNEFFNGVPEGYIDYSASLSKDGFTFLVSSTDLDDAGSDGLDNDSVKFVVSYSVDFSL